MQSRTKNLKTRPQIAAMVARAFAGMELAAGDDAVVELKEGWFNAAYCVRLADSREVILKIAPPPGVEVMEYERNLMATEVAAMRLVRQNPAIPVPAVLFYDDAHDLCESDYFFMEKIIGDNLEHVFASLPPATREAIEYQIGAIIRQVNSFQGSYFGLAGHPDLRASTWKEAFIKLIDALLADGVRKQVVSEYSNDRVRTTVLRHAPALEQVTSACLVHWDAWNPNVFVQDGRVVGLIDFERSLWADPLMEAHFRALSYSSTVTPSMRGYGKTEFNFEEQQRCSLYTLYLGLVIQVECYYRNYDTDMAATIARRLLATSMAWLEAH